MGRFLFRKDGHAISITANGDKSVVTLDGKELEGVTAVSFSAAVDCVTSVTIQLYPKSLEVDGRVESVKKLPPDPPRQKGYRP